VTTTPSRGALLLIDFQHDFLADDGRMPVARNQVEPVLAAVRSAVDAARDRGDLIVRIGNEFKPRDVIRNLLRRHAAIAGSTGARWDPRFDVDGSTYLSKWKSDAFCNPALQEVLSDHEVGRLAVSGLFARACITSTVKSAKDRGFKVLLLEDAIACKSDASRQAAINRLEQIDISTGRAGEEDHGTTPPH
jgi:nicotinamidase-related amidase